MIDLTPDAGDREYKLVGHPDPHLHFNRLRAIAKVSLLPRPVRRTPSAELGTGGRLAVEGPPTRP
ncbi:MAG: hypothetical protein EOO77_07515 [Oxalobacteraceae bacterium]|nr:MAG: hypothetical protein EOO77_07515 [Oxalobacteraceae bacterium]